MADRRAVDLHEDDAQPVGDVFYQRRVAVTGRRDQQQQSHAVGPFAFADHADLLGQVVADDRQVDLIDRLVPHERRQHARAELVEPHVVAGRIDDILPPFDVPERH